MNSIHGAISPPMPRRQIQCPVHVYRSPWIDIQSDKKGHIEKKKENIDYKSIKKIDNFWYKRIKKIVAELQDEC